MKAIKWILVILLAVILVTGGGLFGLRAWRQHQIAQATRIDTPNGIDEGGFVTINGAEEWVTIRGQDRSKPVILFLHGGPSEANSPFVELYQPFEKDFVFAQWDQPGAGKTYIRAGGKQPKLSLEGIAADGVAVAEHLRSKLGKTKIILVGQDWGGLVGLKMIQARPDLFTAFVGTGQLVSWLGDQDVQYKLIKEHAEAEHNQKVLDGLKRVGPPPYQSLKAYQDFGQYYEPYRAKQDLEAQSTLLRMVADTPSLSLSDVFGWVAGLRTGEADLTPVLMAIDLRKENRTFAVPVFFIEGADDTVTPTSLVSDYLAGVTAPVKKLDVVPGAAHMVMWQQPEAFLSILKADLQAASALPVAAH